MSIYIGDLKDIVLILCKPTEGQFPSLEEIGRRVVTLNDEISNVVANEVDNVISPRSIKED